MEQKKNINELPDSICLASERKDADNALRQAIRDLQGAYKGLSGIAELSPVSTDLADITTEWLKGKIDKRIELVRNDQSLTEDERTARLHSWASIRARATRYIYTIQSMMDKWPNATWCYDEAVANFYCNNIDEVVESMSTHHTSEEAKTHWKLVQLCLEKVRELRAWEDDHDVKTQRLADLQCLSGEAFAEMWVCGGVKFDRKTAEKYGMSVGNYHDPKHPERVII